jgi:transposase
LPNELGFGYGMTCRRRLRDWNNAGVWQRLHEVLLGELRAAGKLDLSRAVVDSSMCGRSRLDQTNAGGVSLAVLLTGGNRNDVTRLIPLLQAIPLIHGKRGRPRRRAVEVEADRGYDHDEYRTPVRELSITPVIARRGTEHGSGLGKLRWVV